MRNVLIVALIVGAFIAGHQFSGMRSRSPDYALINGRLVRNNPDGTRTSIGPAMGIPDPEDDNEPNIVEPPLPSPESQKSVGAKTEVDLSAVKDTSTLKPTPSMPPIDENPHNSVGPPQATLLVPPQVTAAAPPPSRTIEYTTYENRDVSGHDIEILKNVDLLRCISECRGNMRCYAYSFDKWNRYCFLKSDTGPLRLDPQSVTGVRDDLPVPPMATSPITMERYRGKAFPGSGYKSFSTVYATCEVACRNEPACVAYTFRKDDGSCHLFNGTSEYLTNNLADSGVKRQGP